MEDDKNLGKFLTLVSDETSELQETIQWRKANRIWLNRSAKIAAAILTTLRKNRTANRLPGTQKELAEKMGVSPQRINKILRGQENLTLEMIAHLEQALELQLIHIQTESSSVVE